MHIKVSQNIIRGGISLLGFRDKQCNMKITYRLLLPITKIKVIKSKIKYNQLFIDNKNDYLIFNRYRGIIGTRLIIFQF